MCCFPFSIRLCIRVSLVSSAEEADVLYLIEHTFGIDCLQEANKIGNGFKALLNLKFIKLVKGLFTKEFLKPV